ncbi:MAG: hypothetical protein AAFX99_35420, partial [Myxococcota bacterium]
MVAKYTQCIVLLTAVLFFTTPILAQEIDDDEEDELPYASVVVQNRKNLGTHELSVGFGVLALDAFTKGITASGSYTIHFNEIIGWEVAQFVYSFQFALEIGIDVEGV